MAEKLLADAIIAAGTIGVMFAAVIGFSTRRRFVRGLMVIIGGISFAAAVLARRSTRIISILGATMDFRIITHMRETA